LIHEVKSAQQIIEETVSQFHAITARMGAMAATHSFG
jgi:enoyl-[acyl-carrier protein] reductase II